jgi:RNase P subunit RPR2
MGDNMVNEIDGSLVCLFLLVGISVALVLGRFFIARRNAKRRTQPISDWQAFANSAGLSFNPADIGISEQITGDYRDHHLTLTCIDNNTIITLLANNSPKVSTASAHIDNLTVEQLLNSAVPPAMLDTLDGDFSATRSGTTLTYQQPGRENDVDTLQFTINALCNLAETYPQIVTLSGSAMPTLTNITTNPDHKLRQYATALLEDIAQKIRVELLDPGEHNLCPDCLVYCGNNKIRLSQLDSITYYGCRSCGRSNEAIEWKGQIIAVLDNTTVEEQMRQHDILKVNWLIRRSLFDFDEVHIIRATDEDVERFAVQIGNDTDEVRKSRYPKMRCNVSKECQLSPNTTRILQHTFGQINTNKI